MKKIGYKVIFGCLMILISYDLNAQHVMPDRGFEQFREDLKEIESADQKLEKYMEASVRFSPSMPDSVFLLAEELRNSPEVDQQTKEAYLPFILANAWRVVNKDSVIHYAELATNRLRDLGAHEEYLRMENLLGLELSRNREYIKADSVLKNAIAYSQTMEEVEYPVAYFYGNLGSLYSMVGAHDLAIQMYEKMLETEDSPGNRCNILSKLSVSLANINEQQRGIELLSPCLEFDQLPPPIRAIVRSNLSSMYEEIGDDQRSLQLMEQAAEITTQFRIPNLEVSHQIRLGEKYLASGLIDKAEQVRERIEKFPPQKFTPHFVIDKYLFYAHLEMEKGENRNVVHFATSAISAAEKSNLRHILKDAYEVCAKAYENLGELDKALEYERLQARLSKSQHDREVEKDIAMMSVRYQLQNKDVALLNANQELKSLKTGTIFIIILIIILTGYAIYRYRIYYLMQEVNTRNRIARDLHDDLSGTLSSISFFSEAAKRVKEDADNSARFLQMIDKSAVEAKEKINDIIWAIDPGNDDWSVFLHKCKRFAADALDSQEIEYEIIIAEDLNIPPHLELRQNIWLIFKELINNLVRHSKATDARVEITEKNEGVYLKVEDNGVGFDPNKETNRHGLKNIRHRAELVNAKINLISEPEKGTTWIINFTS